MSKTLTKVGVVIVNFNGAKDTISCLESLSRCTHSNNQLYVVVVDNNSPVSDFNLLQKYYKHRDKSFSWELIVNSTNLGFAGGNNAGVRYLDRYAPDYFLLLNNDTEVEKALIDKLVDKATQSPKIGVIGPKIYFFPGCEYHLNRYQKEERGKVIWYAGGVIDWSNVLLSHRGVDEVDKGQYSDCQTTDFVSGCAMFLQKRAFYQVGLFDERYYLYLEDADLCERFKKAGFGVLYDGETCLWHKNAASSGKPGSDLHLYYQTRNRLLFGFCYASMRTRLALIRESLKYLFDKRRKKAVSDFYFGNFGKGL